MQLIDLLNIEGEMSVRGVTADSRQVKKGFLFAALPGSKAKGTDFIADAIRHGASIILADENTVLPEGTDDVVLIKDKNPRQAFAKIAAKFYKLQPKHIVVVTGTSGKTSTVSFVQQIWNLSGVTKCASLGTLGLLAPGIKRYGSLTTPDTQSLHADLADLASAGIEHLAMEASSHGLDQYRLDGVNVTAAGYTNLSRDHLDYHKDMDDYFDAKSRLFSEVMERNSVAVLNADDEYFERLKNICEDAGHRVISFGYAGDNIKITNLEAKPEGQNISFLVDGKEYQVTLPLVGAFQAMNALCALALILAEDNNPDKYVPILSQLSGVSGRLQFISGHPKDAAIYVDYAHKPAALEAVLKTLRSHTSGKLFCIFGCGGNRDQGKRALMGKIAGELADVVIVTDDNPRDEDASEIRAQVMSAVSNAREIGDRADAIRTAVQELSEGDVLVVAGKGHEQGQIVAGEVYAFDDVEEVKKSVGGIKL